MSEPTNRASRLKIESLDLIALAATAALLVGINSLWHEPLNRTFLLLGFLLLVPAVINAFADDWPGHRRDR